VKETFSRTVNTIAFQAFPKIQF